MKITSLNLRCLIKGHDMAACRCSRCSHRMTVDSEAHVWAEGAEVAKCKKELKCEVCEITQLREEHVWKIEMEYESHGSNQTSFWEVSYCERCGVKGNQTCVGFGST